MFHPLEKQVRNALQENLKEKELQIKTIVTEFIHDKNELTIGNLNYYFDISGVGFNNLILQTWSVSSDSLILWNPALHF